jgi:hypothetical protein
MAQRACLQGKRQGGGIKHDVGGEGCIHPFIIVQVWRFKETLLKEL